MKSNHRLVTSSLFLLILFCAGMSLSTLNLKVAGYTPEFGHNTVYDYGFISSQPNQTAAYITGWTGVGLADGNYTMQWQQYVNLSISIYNIVLIGSTPHAFYNRSVIIHSNVVTISNSSWQTTITLNGSVSTPAPTGIDSRIIELPTYEGLEGFFLDGYTLARITEGTNVTIGTTSWDSVILTTYSFGTVEQASYQLYNIGTSGAMRIETRFIIDQDVGIYYFANETTSLTVGSTTQTLSYYYRVLVTTISLVQTADSFLPFVAIIAVAIIGSLILTLIIRRIWLRRNLSAGN